MKLVALLILLEACSCFAQTTSKIQEAAVRLNEESALIVDILFANDVAEPGALANLSNFLLLDVESNPLCADPGLRTEPKTTIISKCSLILLSVSVKTLSCIYSLRI